MASAVQASDIEVADRSLDKNHDVEAVAAADTNDAILHGFRLCAVIVGLYFGALMMSLDISIIGTAIPSITSEFGDTSKIPWYPAAYTFAICAFTPLAGKMASIFPLKWVYLSFSTVFLIGSIVCGAAPSANALIVGRAVSGLGAGGVASNGLTILVTVSPAKLKQLAVGLGAACFAIGLVLSPVLGGVFTERLTWRWCFWINLPFIAVTLLVVALFCKSPPSQGDGMSIASRIQSLDLLGCVLFAPSIFMLLLAMQKGGEDTWNSATIIGLFVGFGVLTVIFLAWEYRRGDEAMIPASVAGRVTIVCVTLFAFFHLGSITIASYYLPEWFQAVQGVGPQESGVRMLPSVLTQIVAAGLASGISRRLKYYNYWFFAAPVFMVVSCALYTQFTPSTPSSHWIGFQVIHGFAGGFGMQFSTLAAQLELKDNPTLIPVGIALVMFVQYLGATVLQTVAGVIFNSDLREQLTNHVGLAPQEVGLLLRGGIRNIRHIVEQNFADKLEAILEAYNSAITKVFYVPVAGAVMALILACGIKWNVIETPEPAKPVKESGKTQEPQT